MAALRHPIRRREFIGLASAGAIASAAGTSSRSRSAQTGAKPNILFVLSDQHRFNALGCMGNSFIKTPNLDKLARQGMVFRKCYSSAPVCTPYRAQLMTGRYSHTTGVVANDMKLPSEEICLAEVLKPHGYATGYIGKWHLNAGRPSPAGTVERTGFVRPEDRQGWEFWAALECSHEYFEAKYFGDTPESIPVKGYEPDVQTDLAIQFMSTNRNRPFCLMVSWGPPHNPYQPPQKFDVYDSSKVPLPPNIPLQFQKPARETLAKYYGLVTSLDENMGRLADTLDQLGIADRTIIIYTSDHGDMLYSHGEVLKQKPWEESAHVPLILRYPAKIKQNQSSHLLFSSVDFMPTLLGFAGVPIPKQVQGKDLSPIILGKSQGKRESVYLECNSRGPAGVPQGDWRAVCTAEWKYVMCKDADWLLFNLKDDPHELSNLVCESGYRSELRRLRGMLVQWAKNTGDDLSRLQGNPSFERRKSETIPLGSIDW